MLISKEASSISVASSFLNKASDIEKNYSIPKDKDKLRVKIDDLIKLMNANNKVDALSSNVLELEDIMKGNVNKLVNNMGELDTAERKSSMMAELSMQFERDSKALEQKMKRRKCMMKAMIAGCVSLVLGIAMYVLFL